MTWFSRLPFTINLLAKYRPAIYWLIGIGFFILIIVFIELSQNSTSNVPMIILFILCSVLGYYFYGYKKGLIGTLLAGFIILIIVAVVQTPIDDLLKKVDLNYEQNKVANLIKQKQYNEAHKLGVYSEILEKVTDSEVLRGLIEFYAFNPKAVDYGAPFNSSTIAKANLDVETVKRILKNSQNFYVKLLIFDYYQDYADINTVLDLYNSSRHARDYLMNNLKNIRDHATLKRVIDKTNILEDAQHINLILPNLSYPAFAEELREIATNIKVFSKNIRLDAKSKLPADDVAYERRYCPKCGSSKITARNAYLGYSCDMYFYGQRCNKCNHESSLPEGYAGKTYFDVAFEDLFK